MKEERLCDNIVLYTFEWNYITSKMYILTQEDNMLIIDPVYTEEIATFLTNQIVENVVAILTHEHFDHINGVNWLREYFECVVYANAVCSEHIQSETKNLSNHSEVIMMFNKMINPQNIVVTPFTCSADIKFNGKLEFNWTGHSVELVTTPGHTDGSICIIVDKQYLFTGDTLLDVPTITRLPGGSRKKFHEITLPYLQGMVEKNYRVFPGHGENGSLEDMLKKYNKKEAGK